MATTRTLLNASNVEKNLSSPNFGNIDDNECEMKEAKEEEEEEYKILFWSERIVSKCQMTFISDQFVMWTILRLWNRKQTAALFIFVWIFVENIFKFVLTSLFIQQIKFWIVNKFGNCFECRWKWLKFMFRTQNTMVRSMHSFPHFVIVYQKMHVMIVQQTTRSVHVCVFINVRVFVFVCACGFTFNEWVWVNFKSLISETFSIMKHVNWQRRIRMNFSNKKNAKWIEILMELSNQMKFL